MNTQININWINSLSEEKFSQELERCCGSSFWVKQMIKNRPYKDENDFFQKVEKNWWTASKADWLEAFSHHPRIGDIKTLETKFANTKNWASSEQGSVAEANQSIIKALYDNNIAYEKKFGYIFIVCATGKSAEEMLSILKMRVKNDPEIEIKKAAEENIKITKLRLEKLCKEAQLPHTF